MYLLKYLAHCGLCSRRNAAELIKTAVICVNGEIVTMPFALVKEGDVVTYKGKIVKPESYIYLVLNKPKGFLTTCSDESGRRTVMDLIKAATKKRIYPVGRLDRMSTGILFFTNDGALSQKLSHPSNNVSKVYRVLLDRPMKRSELDRILNGFSLEDGFIKADRCQYGKPRDKRDVVLELHSGRNRIVRRMFQHLGFKVLKLDRVGYAGMQLQDLPRGVWRFLTADEVKKLKNS